MAIKCKLCGDTGLEAVERIQVHYEPCPNKCPIPRKREEYEAPVVHTAHKDMLGCYYCTHIFKMEDVTDYVDDGKTALCPNCFIDAVVSFKAALRKLQADRFNFGVEEDSKWSN